ncbi:hypothetical protein Ocin01_15287 [Orchesella cincta]|uniref:Uncharacterized protein n=1 Tax=Orchesella cincta TaxID=48709 RepID=A0A1D2MEF0_ORCCI|nr:hypothetical protein Ocin01_15287 [Orchesella cincta]
MSSMYHSVCDLNLQKGMRILAIVDLIFATMLVFYELSTLHLVSGGSGPAPLIVNETITLGTDVDVDSSLKASSTHIWIVVATFFICAIYISLEFWMFRVLTNASKNLDLVGCKIYFWARVAVCIPFLILCYFYAFLIPLQVYRAAELKLVTMFRNEIVSSGSGETTNITTNNLAI